MVEVLLLFYDFVVVSNRDQLVYTRVYFLNVNVQQRERETVRKPYGCTASGGGDDDDRRRWVKRRRREMPWLDSCSAVMRREEQRDAVGFPCSEDDAGWKTLGSTSVDW
ncbi:hypothetical protein M0R45_009671 [Rubus argutus]|uniref:Uncharacterized protein n=1 Tax=Rubus argutus TaxID=59490 RepID=A0AAW1Y8M2_RUBAR